MVGGRFGLTVTERVHAPPPITLTACIRSV